MGRPRHWVGAGPQFTQNPGEAEPMDDVINLNDFETPDSGHKGDAVLLVQFYKKSVLNKLKTYGGSKRDEFGNIRKDAEGKLIEYTAAGRPVYDQVDYIKITAPDTVDKHNVAERPATEADKRRFSKQYKAFLERSTAAPDGTPLEKWPLIEANQVDELRYLGVRTVEKLANTKPGEIPDIGGLGQLIQRANDYLNAAKGNAAQTQLRTELNKRDEKIDALQRQLAELVAAQQAKPKAPKKTKQQPQPVTEE